MLALQKQGVRQQQGVWSRYRRSTLLATYHWPICSIFILRLHKAGVPLRVATLLMTRRASLRMLKSALQCDWSAGSRKYEQRHEFGESILRQPKIYLISRKLAGDSISGSRYV